MDKLNIIRSLDDLFTPVYRKIHHTHYNMAIQALEGAGTKVLDVACGNGKFMSMLNADHHLDVTAVDIFPPYLKKAKATGVYSKLVKSDIRKLPFKAGQFDICFCSQAIEHLSKSEGFAFMGQLEKIARKRVVIITPAGDLPQDPYDGNKYQRHLSTWHASDFIERGYHVRGQGLKCLYGTGNAVKKWGFISYLFAFLSLLAGPLLNIFPDLGVYIFCTKDLNK